MIVKKGWKESEMGLEMTGARSAKAATAALVLIAHFIGSAIYSTTRTILDAIHFTVGNVAVIGIEFYALPITTTHTWNPSIHGN
jgi:hypothetical protein